MNRVRVTLLGIALGLAKLQVGCVGTTTEPDAEGDVTPGAGLIAPQTGEDGRPAGWANESHTENDGAGYSTAFPDSEVKRLDITIAPNDWQAMQGDMVAKYGEPGTSGGLGGFAGLDGELPDGFEDLGDFPVPDGANPEDLGDLGDFGDFPVPDDFPDDFDPSEFPVPDGDFAGGAAGFPGGAIGLSDGGENPIYVPCHVEFEGKTWWYVGIRYKGNSSLLSTWQSGIGKLPLRLDFDQFEDEYPETRNQRFYGFQDLSLASNWSDPSLLREKIGHDIFRDAGVPAPRTSFYRVYVDFGDGPTYFGLYTMTEIPDTPLLTRYWGDDSGNLYKPTSDWVAFNEAAFDKETNKSDSDWADVQSAIAALHADRSDPETWRAGLESVFNVDGFLRWLAVNTLIVNWDSYGRMAHNYYLYANHGDSTRLNWIPWDLNLAMSSTLTFGAAPSLELDDVGDGWPLISYLLDDPVYWSTYVRYVRQASEGAFAVDRAQARFQAAHDLIAPFVVGSDGEQPGYTFVSDPQEFDNALSELLGHVVQRQEAALEFLAAHE